MLVFLTLGVMAAVAYAASREGVLMAITSLVNTVIAGLVAFNFYEPLAPELGGLLKGTFAENFEDGITMFGLFAATLGLLRALTNQLASNEVELPALIQQVGSGVIALVTGYLIAGILVCMFQTLPWGENFLGFEYKSDPQSAKVRNLFPPDRAWLAMMNLAGRTCLSQENSVTFDPDGTFELRYARLRRYKEQPQ